MLKLRYIDSLRGIAVLLVILFHCGQYEGLIVSKPIAFILSNGTLGVQLFYLVSAFTLFFSFEEKHKKEIHPTRNFFIRRFFRIAPLFYLTIFYYLFQNGLGNNYWLCDTPSVSTSNILSNFFFLNGFYPYWFNSIVPGGWSIAIETSFYIIFPFIFYIVKDLRSSLIFFMLSAIFMALFNPFLKSFQLISCDRLWQEYIAMYIVRQLPVFALGSIMYFMIKEETFLSFKMIVHWIFFLTAIFLSYKLFGFNNLLPVNVLYSFILLFICLVLSKYEIPILVNKFTIYLGKISYSMYLLHFAVLFWLQQSRIFDFIAHFFESQENSYFILRSIIVLVASGVISTISFHFIEIPFQKFGRSIINRLEPNLTEQTNVN